jgi:hypothetical protein
MSDLALDLASFEPQPLARRKKPAFRFARLIPSWLTHERRLAQLGKLTDRLIAARLRLAQAQSAADTLPPSQSGTA